MAAIISKDSDVSVSQLSVSQSVHALDVQRQLVVDHLLSISLVPTLRLQGKQLDKTRRDETGVSGTATGNMRLQKYGQLTSNVGTNKRGLLKCQNGPFKRNLIRCVRHV